MENSEQYGFCQRVPYNINVYFTIILFRKITIKANLLAKLP